MLSRRQFIKVAASSTGLFISACHNKHPKSSATAKVVIIGGGFGGATAAKMLKTLDPTIQVTLIEPKPHYISCPASNWVLAGLTSVQSLYFSYKTLADDYDINVIQQFVTAIDPDKHLVICSDQQKIHYDRLIVAPGIDFRWDIIEGHNETTSHLIPHAWKAGAQTTLLHNQLKAMPDGGTVAICAPPNPFRCPPGPYERASMIAHYLKQHKPKSKIIILDPKSTFSKQNLFIEGWKKHYGYGSKQSMIEWHSIADNPIIKIDIKNKVLETDFGDKFKADVINYIPAQKAGKIAHTATLCDESGWCPVSHKTSESTLHPNIHIIGDASIHNPLPKSAFAANAEAKTCAFAIAALLNNIEIPEPTWINTCYSLITADQGISIAMVYKLNLEGQIIKVEGAGGVTKNTNQQSLALEAEFARKWFASITADSFG